MALAAALLVGNGINSVKYFLQQYPFNNKDEKNVYILSMELGYFVITVNNTSGEYLKHSAIVTVEL